MMKNIFVVLLLVSVCSVGNSQTENTDCECVPYYQCNLDGTWNTGGKNVFDIRGGFDDNDPFANRKKCEKISWLCCADKEKVPGTDVGPPKPKPHVGKGCGYRNRDGVDFKITGAFNNEAEFGEFPWMVAVMGTSKVDDYLSGGSLIHPRVVLTGAHHVYGKSASKLKIRAGEWDFKHTREPLPHQDRKVSVVITHPKFDNENLYNDFALLILETPVDLADNVETTCLPEPNEQFDHSKCFVTGWGKKEFGAQHKNQVILKAVELPAVPKYECEKGLRTTRLGRHFELDQSFMCAGGVAGVDACTGDGGSPLVCPLPNDPTRYTQAGIVAWGIGCGEDGVPGVYGDVTKARRWIDEQLASYNIDSSSYTPAAANPTIKPTEPPVKPTEPPVKPGPITGPSVQVIKDGCLCTCPIDPRVKSKNSHLIEGYLAE